jgi:hypothetical protein
MNFKNFFLIIALASFASSSVFAALQEPISSNQNVSRFTENFSFDALRNFFLGARITGENFIREIPTWSTQKKLTGAAVVVGALAGTYLIYKLVSGCKKCSKTVKKNK